MIACYRCRRAYPDDSVPYRCPDCGGVFGFQQIPTFDPDLVESDQPGLWRYRHTFGLPDDAPVVTLGEGDTPLVWSQALGREIAFKLEYISPTGSFKDRASALLVSFLLSRRVGQTVEDSSGNAGASYAAYAASEGIQARIYVPGYASGPKRAQIEAYGAEVVAVPGPRSQAASAVREAADHGAVYASHAYLPQGSPGFATIAYELIEQIGAAPGTLIAPVGHGSLMLGVGRGFKALLNAGLIERMPLLVGVQAAACAPLAAAFNGNPLSGDDLSEGETHAEGVRIVRPLRTDVLIDLIESSRGFFVTVEEGDILPGRDHLARLGFYVEPTSAIVWSALEQVAGQVPEPIAVILTGSGLKHG
jgi:threonine synthase